MVHKKHLNNHPGIASALGRIPSGLFILTAGYEDRRIGMLASWVQQVSFEPPMVSVALGKARPIMSLISASRQFGICQLPKDEKVILRKFAGRLNLDEDPFLGFDLLAETVTSAPILTHVLGYLECELACHIDVDADHELLVGKVCGGNYFTGQPHVHLRDNGFKY